MRPALLCLTVGAAIASVGCAPNRPPAVAAAAPRFTDPGVLRIAGNVNQYWNDTDDNASVQGASVFTDVAAFVTPGLALGVILSGSRMAQSFAQGSAFHFESSRGTIGPSVMLFPLDALPNTRARAARLSFAPYLSFSQTWTRGTGSGQSSTGTTTQDFRSDDHASESLASVGSVFMLNPQVGLDLALQHQWLSRHGYGLQPGSGAYTFRGDYQATALQLGFVTFFDTRPVAPPAGAVNADVADRGTLEFSGGAGISTSSESDVNSDTPQEFRSNSRSVGGNVSASYLVRRGVGAGVLFSQSWGSSKGTNMDWRVSSHGTGIGPKLTVFPFELRARPSTLGNWHPYVSASHTFDHDSWTTESPSQINGGAFIRSTDDGSTTIASAGALFMFSRHVGLDIALDRLWRDADSRTSYRFLATDPLQTSTSQTHERRWQLNAGIATFLKLRD